MNIQMNVVCEGQELGQQSLPLATTSMCLGFRGDGGSVLDQDIKSSSSQKLAPSDQTVVHTIMNFRDFNLMVNPN